MFTLNCKGRLLEFSSPIVMGIINATPDSFYSGSRKQSVTDALHTAEKMLVEGAVILDIGGQSTRPGANSLTAAEETERVLPIIEAISRKFPQSFLSVDTYSSAVARAAVEHGAVIVNDISGGNFDNDMLATIASLHVPYVCMHVKGTLETMHTDPQYSDVTKEVLDYFIERTATCTKAGINDIIIDPGFGFSKNRTHNFQLLKHLEIFSIFRKPLLLGISRKSTIYKTLGITAEEALNGTTVLHTAGLLKGASILRVHDVKEAVEAIKLTSHLK
ncbi:MAG: folP [Sediminibacterium sp.]|nr:folP [Sediminibacterium sp.]